MSLSLGKEEYIFFEFVRREKQYCFMISDSLKALQVGLIIH